MLKIVRLLEKDLKRLRLFKVLLQIAFLHGTVTKKHQQAIILQRQHIFNSLGEALRNFFRKLLLINGNEIVIILRASPHCQHQ